MSRHALIVRGGTVVDGTGEPARTADVAIDDGVVTEVGKITGEAARTIDADGLLVTPGFVDIHCHYDGQASWGERMIPSSWHGVTTVVVGNCGVGFAPVHPADHDRLIELMEGVEDIPGTVLHEGLAWNWQSFPEFMDALDGRPFDVDVAVQVPHGALRLHVMGERGARREAATASDIEAMARLAREGIEAGALGFSTSRTLNHRTSKGEYTPTLTAGADELVGIAQAIGATGKGVLQVVSDFADVDAEFAIFRRMAETSGRPLSFSLVQVRGDGWRRQLELLSAANADGVVMTAQVAPRAVGLMLGLQCTLHPLLTNPVYREVAALPLAERVAVMTDPVFKQRVLDADGAQREEGKLGGLMIHAYHRMYELDDPPDYEPDRASSIASRAEREGRAPLDLAYDVMLHDGGRSFLYLPSLNYGDGNLDAVGEMLAHPNAVVGLADGGAHVGTICDASFPTTLLTLWARDRGHGRLDLPFVVQRQTRDTARAVGLLDRGVLAPGYRADLNLIDFERLTARRPEIRHDLPAGGKRLVQSAEGYVATLVAGEVTYENGEARGPLPGRLVRGPQAVSTNPVATKWSRAMKASDLTPLETGCEWRTDELGDGYIFELTPAHLDELDRALLHAEASCDDVLDITREAFPLPTLGPELGRLTRDLIDGRGVALIRGLPVDRYGKERASSIYWGVGMHLGQPWPQNAKGHLLGDVTDQGRAPTDPTSRGNEIGGIAFPFHSDGSDLVGLFCLDAGAGGGASLVANVVSIHNELVRTEAELAAELYAPFPYDLRGEQAPGTKPWYTMPIFSRCGDRLFARYIRPYIESTRRHEDAPRPSDTAHAAMDRVDTMCADPQFHVSMALQPGDMQFVNNYHVLHARAAYEDDRAAGRIRHLKRLWLETDLLADGEKPERFRLGRTDNWWASKGRTKSELNV